MRKNYVDLSECKGCVNCKHYPYFHFIPANDYRNTGGKEIDLEFIKTGKDAEVTNHTTGEKYSYSAINHKWTKNGK